MQENIKLFLFTCVYNEKKRIKTLFDSLLSQTSNNFIHYIYDDGSCDDVSQIIYKYIIDANNKQNSYQVIYERCEKNKGNLYATQHCIEKINNYRECSHFGWINADDWVEKNYVENLIKIIKRKNKQFEIFCCYKKIYKYINERYQLVQKKDGVNNLLTKKGDKLVAFLQNCFYISPFVASIDFFNKNKFKLQLDCDNKKYYNDVQILFLYALHNARFLYIKKEMYCFCKHIDNLSVGTSFNCFDNNDLECLAATAKIYNKKLNLLELQNKTAVYKRIINLKKPTRKEIIKILREYKKYKNEQRLEIKLFFKFRIFCLLIIPKLVQYIK